MNEQPTGPLKIDLRLVLETIAAGLAFVLAGVAAVDPPGPYDVIVPLIVGAILVMIYRLLGRSSDAVVAALTTEVRALVAEKSVLRSDATVAVKAAAQEAGEALRPVTKA